MATRTRRVTLRRIAGRIAVRVPFGVGRVVRDYAATRQRLRQLETQLRQQDELVRRREEQLRRREEQAAQFARVHRQLVAAALGREPEQAVPATNTGLLPDKPMPSRTLLRRLHDQGRFFDQLLVGAPLEAAVTEYVRARLDADEHATPRSLSHSLQTGPTTTAAGQLGSAVVAIRKGLPDLAWSIFRKVSPRDWRRFAPAEYLRTGFRVDPQATAATVAAILDDPPDDLSPVGWIELIKATLGADQPHLAERALQVADALAAHAAGEWAGTVPARDWLRHWLGDAARRTAPPPVSAGHVSVAVLDYKQPDWGRTSRNLGDYVQTLASLGHLVRHRNLRFHGSPELVDLAEELQERVWPDRVLDTPERDVTLVPVNRDASNRDPVPEPTWLVAFGWYMHHTFGRYDFPMHPNLRPLFVSFHCNRPEILTPAVVEYLRTYGPVGCRDWTTVDMLLSFGVPAFFSGCLTTTTSTVFPELADHELPPADAPVVHVDVAAPAGAEQATQEGAQVRHTGLVQNLRDAMELMEGYRRHYSAIVTSRLHCYLPVRSLGANVEFRPLNPADIRFNGLTGLTDTAYAQMQQGFLDRLEAVLTAVLAGKDESEVYTLWRDLCAPDVARAMERRASVPAMPPPSFDVSAACAVVRAGQVEIAHSAPGPGGQEVHVALALDGNLKEELRVVVQGMVDHASRPLHLWILCRDHGPDDYQDLAARFPEVSVTWLPCDKIDYGPVAGMLEHITVSTMDRLLLPELLPELDRLLYHDIDALPLADISPLYDWDLQGQPLAGRSAVSDYATSGFGNMLRCARRLRDDPDSAYDCVRRMCSRHRYDFTGFNAGILVLDLARMRADQFCREFLPFVERYGMNDQEVLNCYAGPNRATLPPEWNSFPTQEPVEHPRIVHWAGSQKPWKRECVPLREKWTEYASRMRDRAAEPAAGSPGRRGGPEAAVVAGDSAGLPMP